MARPRNEASREAISSAAFNCFIKIGYDATTYDQLSKRSKISRPLVQHYFPHKSMLAKAHLASMFDQCSELARNYTPAMFNGHEAFAAHLYVTGQLYFGFLADTGKLFFADILKSRELTNELIDLSPIWANIETNAEDSLLPLDSASTLCALGGFYELAFSKLSSGQTLDIAEAFGKAISAMLQDAGSSRARAVRVTSESALTSTELSKALASIKL